MKTTMRLSAMTIAVFVASVLNAATLRVVSKAADKTGDWADAYLSISEAVSAANANDTILVASGRYVLSGTLTLSKAHLTIRSASLTTGEEDREGTVIDGGDDPANSVDGVRLFFIGATYCTISGFTLAHGYYAGNGAAVYCNTADNSRYFHINNCIFTGNRSTGSGTCIYSYTTHDGTVSDCVFTNNTLISTGNSGGCAIYTQQNTATASDRIEMLRCTFGTNTMSGTGINGVSVWASRAILLDECTFLAGDSVTRTGNNSSKGLSVVAGANSEIRNCFFTGPTAGIDGYKYGTCLCIDGANGVVSNCTFTGIDETVGGFGVVNFSGDNTKVIDCRFTNNRARGNFLFSYSKTGHLIRNSLFSGNTVSGGLLHDFTGGKLDVFTVETCTIAGNTCSSGLLTSGNNVSTNWFINSILTESAGTCSGTRIVVA